MRIFETKLRVRYQETDAMGVVYHSNYLVWFEVARTELLREIGFSYTKMEESGLYLVVVDASCRYKSPCRYDDLVAVRISLAEVKNTSMVFDYTILVKGKVVALGRTAHVFTDRSSKPARIPAALKDALTSLA